MQKETKFSDFFRISIELMKIAKIDYLIIGGVAIGVWGNLRLTQDIDIMLFIAKKNVKTMLDKAMSLGFRFEEKVVTQKIRQVGVFKIFYENYHLDFLLASTDLEESALHRKVKVKIFEQDVFVPSKEDLLLLKIIPARPKDILDAEGIASRQKGKLDVQYLEFWAQRLSDEAQDMRIYNELQRLLNLK